MARRMALPRYRSCAALRSAGHEVFTPTHTGVGERAHQGAENITLETHIRDVCGCIEAEELSNVVLCGHSYGGMVITGRADRMPERIKTLVYLDAFLPENGQSLISLLPLALPPEISAACRKHWLPLRCRSCSRAPVQQSGTVCTSSPTAGTQAHSVTLRPKLTVNRAGA